MVVIVCIIAYVASAEQKQPFKPYINTSNHAGMSRRIYAGEIHYTRIPVEYWEHRIKMVKAMGLNALSVYIMWNYHEIEKGKFDF